MKRSEKHICALVNNNYRTIRTDKDYPVWQRQLGTLFRRDGKIRSNRHQSGSSARPGLLCGRTSLVEEMAVSFPARDYDRMSHRGLRDVRLGSVGWLDL